MVTLLKILFELRQREFELLLDGLVARPHDNRVAINRINVTKQVAQLAVLDAHDVSLLQRDLALVDRCDGTHRAPRHSPVTRLFLFLALLEELKLVQLGLHVGAEGEGADREGLLEEAVLEDHALVPEALLHVLITIKLDPPPVVILVLELRGLEDALGGDELGLALLHLSLVEAPVVRRVHSRHELDRHLVFVVIYAHDLRDVALVLAALDARPPCRHRCSRLLEHRHCVHHLLNGHELQLGVENPTHATEGLLDEGLLARLDVEEAVRLLVAVHRRDV
mmetsp:Transcript_67065/g.165434  ORF Transcript_67065/g.165434 Transcript_67065/m.165434 type:complete len:280 (-) Transcript_67065:733-1572(-)